MKISNIISDFEMANECNIALNQFDLYDNLLQMAIHIKDLENKNARLEHRLEELEKYTNG